MDQCALRWSGVHLPTYSPAVCTVVLIEVIGVAARAPGGRGGWGWGKSVSVSVSIVASTTWRCEVDATYMLRALNSRGGGGTNTGARSCLIPSSNTECNMRALGCLVCEALKVLRGQMGWCVVCNIVSAKGSVVCGVWCVVWRVSWCSSMGHGEKWKHDATGWFDL